MASAEKDFVEEDVTLENVGVVGVADIAEYDQKSNSSTKGTTHPRPLFSSSFLAAALPSF